MKQILDDYAPILNVTPETKELASKTPDKQPTELKENTSTSNTHSSKENKPEPQTSPQNQSK